jgi:hypothetical protein
VGSPVDSCIGVLAHRGRQGRHGFAFQKLKPTEVGSVGAEDFRDSVHFALADEFSVENALSCAEVGFAVGDGHLQAAQNAIQSRATVLQGLKRAALIDLDRHGSSHALFESMNDHLCGGHR